MRVNKKEADPGSEKKESANEREGLKGSKNAVESQPRSWILGLVIKLVDSGVLALLPNPTVKVYIVLLRYRFKDKQGFMMSNKRMAEKTGLSVRAVAYGVRQLEAAKLITKKRGPKSFHGMNMYYVPLDPAIDMQELKLELHLQRKRLTRYAQNSTRVNRKSAKKRGYAHCAEPLGMHRTAPPLGMHRTAPLKKVTNDKYVKREEATCNPHPPTPAKVEALIKKTSKAFTERKTTRPKTAKLDSGERAYAQQMSGFIAKSKKKEEIKK